jgi:hypothetical protein
VGAVRTTFMAREHGAALDPRGLLNPAKVLPDGGQDP